MPVKRAPAISEHYSNAVNLIEESGQRQSIEAARECVLLAVAEALLAVAGELHAIRVHADRRNDDGGFPSC